MYISRATLQGGREWQGAADSGVRARIEEEEKKGDAEKGEKGRKKETNKRERKEEKFQLWYSTVII